MIGESIKVFLKIKPVRTPSEGIFIKDERTVIVGNETFTFDGVFVNSSQQDVYVRIANDMVVECMKGYNCVVFAYGQTGSGKTYTMQGDAAEHGLVQKTLGFFHNMNLRMKISFLEIYNEQLFDLFSPENEVTVREDPFKGVYADGLTEISSNSYEESAKFFSDAIKKRKTSSNTKNRESSRSHAIFTISINTDNVLNKSSKIVFVDLAGSERLEYDGILSKKEETSNINRSLLCLGEVIRKLSRSERHVNYRDSKLTFLLRESLAGSSKLAVIGTVDPSESCISETVSTLKFMRRVGKIWNHPVLNAKFCDSVKELKKKIKELDEENQNLKMKLYLMDNGEVPNPTMSRDVIVYRKFTNKIKELTDTLEEELRLLKSDILRIKEVNVNSTRNLLLSISSKQDEIISMEAESIRRMLKDDMNAHCTPNDGHFVL